MNRRTFLARAVVIPVFMPAALIAIYTAPRWKAVLWAEKEFDYGTAMGIVVTARDWVTGKVRQHAVKVYGTMYRYAAEARAIGKQVLNGWIKELNHGA